MNNSLLREKDYQDKIKTVIRDTAEISKTTNPNTLWEIIKESIRNETNKYAAYKKKEKHKTENQLLEEISKVKINDMMEDKNQYDKLNKLKEENDELQNLHETEING